MADLAPLIDATAELIDIASESHNERRLTDHLEMRLRAVPWLTVDRFEDNVIARTTAGRSMRVVLAGHTDTVPANGNSKAELRDGLLWGVGSSDMKSGLAVMMDLAASLPPDQLAVDVTYVFYACEEVAVVHNGLRKVFEHRPDLVAGDVAILGEPTDALIEAGCQGTMRAELRLGGARAHTARPWMGRNAVHRLGTVLQRLAEYEGRRPVLDGCEYREAIQAVKVEGGVAGNVVPDRAVVTINHRFAPDRTIDQALAHVREVIGDDVLADAAELTLIDAAAAAAPSLRHAVLARLAEAIGKPPRAKLGWTDVSIFAANGVPAVNFGPGDPLLAHTAEERVDPEAILQAHRILRSVLTSSG